MADQQSKNAATAKMGAVGIDWLGINGIVQHVIHLLNTEGPAAARVCADILKLVQGISDRDLSGIIAALVSGETDVAKVVADIRAEFGI